MSANQCDGCMRGLPVNGWVNHYEAGRPVMACTATRYGVYPPPSPPPAPLLPGVSASECRELAAELGPLQHRYCEDNWYSCPLAEGGCGDDGVGPDCNCGAEAENPVRARAAAILRSVADAIDKGGRP